VVPDSLSKPILVVSLCILAFFPYPGCLHLLILLPTIEDSFFRNQVSANLTFPQTFHLTTLAKVPSPRTLHLIILDLPSDIEFYMFIIWLPTLQCQSQEPGRQILKGFHISHLLVWSPPLEHGLDPWLASHKQNMIKVMRCPFLFTKHNNVMYLVLELSCFVGLKNQTAMLQDA
jgi:hypothetical protein